MTLIQLVIVLAVFGVFLWAIDWLTDKTQRHYKARQPFEDVQKDGVSAQPLVLMPRPTA